MSSGPTLRMEQIEKRFGATIALAGVSLQAAPGRIHALIGENGAGKSTLMKILSGALQPDAGTMTLGDRPYAPADCRAARRAGVAMIYQELSLAPHLSVIENVLLGDLPRRGPLVDWPAARAAAAEALEAVGRPDLPLDAPVRQLSVAAQQIVEIARGIATGARTLVLDEPTSSLTREDTAHLFALLKRLRARGYAIIYISHFLEEVLELSDSYTVLRDGRRVATGTTADATIDGLVAEMVGRSMDALYPHRGQRTPGETLLELQSLSGTVKPTDASLVLRRGEVLGIAGLVGAGRTELIRTVFGLDPIRTGTVRIAGTSLRPSPDRAWARGVGLLSEDRKGEGLAGGMSLADNLTLPALRDLTRFGWLQTGRQEADTRDWIEQLAIRARDPRQAVTELSGGNQQKVALARLLQARVDVLLLDEPTRGIDIGSKAQIYELIDRLAVGDPDRGVPPKAILVVSSYLPELLGLCDRIGVMTRGRLSPIQSRADLDEQQIMRIATDSGEAA